MVALIAGVSLSLAASALSGYMGQQAQKKAAKIISKASEKEKEELRKYYDSQFGEGSYNEKIQNLGLQAATDYRKLIDDESAWNRFIDGKDAWKSPEQFSFTAEDLMEDPSYKFRLQQGADALAQQLVASGLANSTAAQKMMTDYAQGAASQEFANAYGRKYGEYNDNLKFDYGAWLQNAQQYYANLQSQLAGIGNLAQWGNNANANQAEAFKALAGDINDLTSAKTQAEVNRSNAGWSAGQGIVNTAGAFGTALAMNEIGYNPQTSFGSASSQNAPSLSPSVGYGNNIGGSGSLGLDSPGFQENFASFMANSNRNNIWGS